MCSVVGAVIKTPSQSDFDMLKRVFLEASIRGLHATGVSYIKNGKVITKKDAVPASSFQFNFPEYVNEDGNLYLIGHCRYSTSDLHYNQPISNDEISVVHNGVITQELPEHWEKLYGYACTGKNDTELLLHSLSAKESPLVRWKDSSLAVCELYADKSLRFYRNGKRPIYFTSMKNGYIITSTEDIAARAGLNESSEVPLNTYMKIHSDMSIMFERVAIETIDLQQVDYEIETVSI